MTRLSNECHRSGRPLRSERCHAGAPLTPWRLEARLWFESGEVKPRSNEVCSVLSKKFTYLQAANQLTGGNITPESASTQFSLLLASYDDHSLPANNTTLKSRFSPHFFGAGLPPAPLLLPIPAVTIISWLVLFCAFFRMRSDRQQN